MSAKGVEVSHSSSPQERVTLRAPTIDDGLAVHALIGSCPPLDENSGYCSLLLCTHFTDSCVLAEREGQVVGWVSAYRPPHEPATIFVWQVAVAESARGIGLGRRLLGELLSRPACRSIRRLQTTITAQNDASWALFESLATRLKAPIVHAPWMLADAHLPPGKGTEHLVTIGPFLPALSRA